MTTCYPACFYKEGNVYSVIFPDLHYLATDGDSLENAMDAAIDALAGYILTAREEGYVLPKASALQSIDPQKVSETVYGDSFPGECFVSLVSVDVKEYARTHFHDSVKKTLSIPSWLNDLAIKRGINFSKVLQDALMDMLL